VNVNVISLEKMHRNNSVFPNEMSYTEWNYSICLLAKAMQLNKFSWAYLSVIIISEQLCVFKTFLYHFVFEYK